MIESILSFIKAISLTSTQEEKSMVIMEEHYWVDVTAVKYENIVIFSKLSIQCLMLEHINDVKLHVI